MENARLSCRLLLLLVAASACVVQGRVIGSRVHHSLTPTITNTNNKHTPATNRTHGAWHHSYEEEEEEFKYAEMPREIRHRVVKYCCADKKGDALAACMAELHVLYKAAGDETGALLGTGAFAKVDSVTCGRPDRPDLALKRVCTKSCHTASSKREPAIQQRAADRCCEPGQPCPKVLRFVLAADDVECCDGTDGHHWVLYTMMRGGNALDAANAFEIDPDAMGEQLLRQIRCLHSNGIVHNDVKLDNIQVSEDGTQYGLFDYGVSCMDREVCPPSVAGTYKRIKLNRKTKTVSTNAPSGDYFALAHTVYQVKNVRYGTTHSMLDCSGRSKAQYLELTDICGVFGGPANLACMECALEGGNVVA